MDYPNTSGHSILRSLEVGVENDILISVQIIHLLFHKPVLI